jgi:hypothetical protein
VWVRASEGSDPDPYQAIAGAQRIACRCGVEAGRPR